MKKLDLSKLRQDANHPDPYFLFDDSGKTKYLWSKDGEANALFIWTETFHKREGFVSDQASSHLYSVEDSEGNEIRVFDGTFGAIEKELNALGFDEGSESRWSADMEDEGDIAPLIEYVRKHPRFLRHEEDAEEDDEDNDDE